MARESTQHKLDRVRAPRVQITYDVEVGNANEMKEIPFVMGVLGDFSGKPEQALKAMKDREFVEINPDNFNDVLKGMTPHLSYSVKNTLNPDPNAGQLKVDISFESMDDFSPDKVAEKITPLKDLLNLRTNLSDLIGKLQGNDELDKLLSKAISKTEENSNTEEQKKLLAEQKKLRAELGLEDEGGKL
jgi:type VI secretion system protein ImpB